MLTLLGHAGEPLLPHDVWSAWTFDPAVLVGLALAVVAYERGVRQGSGAGGRRAAFHVAMAAILVALVSPVDAMAGTLVSAHMVQHVLLILVAAPLLAVSAPAASLLRGTPPAVRTSARDLRRAFGLDVDRLRSVRSPVARWLLYVVTLWIWHASVVYGAAVDNEWLHVVEHVTFLGSAFLIWSVILGPARTRMPRGLGFLAVFTLGLQGIFLSALLTFARTPWYADHLAAPDGWGLDPLADQQLAGVLMWIPAGFIHAGIALYLLLAWMRESDGHDDRVVEPATGDVYSL